MLKKFKFASPATALAKSVLHLPYGIGVSRINTITLIENLPIIPTNFSSQHVTRHFKRAWLLFLIASRLDGVVF